MPSWMKYESSRKQKADATKAGCLATAMLADTAGEDTLFVSRESPDLKNQKVKDLISGRGALMNRVGEAYIRFAANHSADVCDVTGLALNQIPVGDSRGITYLKRREWYVRREFGQYWWDQAYEAALKLTETPIAAILARSCEEYLIRAPRGTWKESDDTIRRLEASTIPSPISGALPWKTRFRCPKPKSK